MSIARPALRSRLRGAAVLLGVAVLVWLTLEDRGARSAERLALLFAALTCALIAVRLSLAWGLWSAPPRLLALPLLSAAAGLAVVPLALVFMALKTGLHAHPTPDYTPEQIVWVVSRAPAWALAGLLAGCSLVLLRLRQDQSS